MGLLGYMGLMEALETGYFTSNYSIEELCHNETDYLVKNRNMCFVHF